MPNKTQDYYPQEKGVIRRDRAGEFRDAMAKELMFEALGAIPIGGMASKMGKPAVDVLSRWIRRHRKGKAPTVPQKTIEKAIDNEKKRVEKYGMYSEKGLGNTDLPRTPPGVMTVDGRSQDFVEGLTRDQMDPQYIGFFEKFPFEDLENFLHDISRYSSKIKKDDLLSKGIPSISPSDTKRWDDYIKKHGR